MSFSPIAGLKELLPPADWPRFARALRRQPLIWQALTDEKFFGRARTFAENNIEAWSPAALALLALDANTLYPAILTDIEQPLPDDLRRTAAASLESAQEWHKRATRMEPDLKEAACIALGLRERYRITRDIEDLVNLLQSDPIRLWEAVATILVGCWPEPAILLTHLLNRNHTHYLAALGTHALLTNPWPLDRQTEYTHTSLKTHPLSSALAHLRKIETIWPELTQQVSEKLLTSLPEPDTIESADELLRVADLLQLANRQPESIRILDRAWNIVRRSQAELSARVAQSAAKKNDSETARLALAQAASIMPEMNQISEAMTFARIQTGTLNFSEADGAHNALFSPGHDLPSQIAEARAACDNQQFQEARTLALKALSQVRQERSIETSSVCLVATPVQLIALAETLLACHELENASWVCETLLQEDPTNREALALVCRAQLANRQIQQALESAHLLSALEPEAPEVIRLLALAFVANKDWPAALTTWQKVVSLQVSPPPEDLSGCAEAAIAAQDYKTAAALAQRLLHLQSENSLGHWFLGKALQALGDAQNAVQHFMAATKHNPTIIGPWLALIEEAQISKGISAALQLTHAAIEHNPESAELYFVLGTLHQENKDNSATRAAFQQAKTLVLAQDEPSVITNPRHLYLALAQALVTQGQLEDAKSLLIAANQHFHGDQELAKTLALTYLQLGQPEASIKIYGEVLVQNPEDLPTHLARLDLLLSGDSIKEDILHALEQAEQLAATDPEVRTRAAEYHSRYGDSNTALNIFQELLQSVYGQQGPNRFRLARGLAQAALQLDKPELAIAAIHDLLPSSTSHPGVIKLLCDAYQQAGLNTNALESLGELIRVSSNSTSDLFWAASKALLLDRPRLALAALDKARSISPGSPEVLLRQGITWIQLGDLEAGKKAFAELYNLQNLSLTSLRAAASSLMAVGDLESSLPYLEKALEICEGRSPEILADLVKLHLHKGQKEAALAALERQIHLQPDDLTLLILKANILSEAGKPQSALLTLQTALRNFPQNAQLHINLAGILRQTGEILAALGHARQAQALAPEDVEINVTLGQIAYACLDDATALTALETVTAHPDPGINLLKAQVLLQAGQEVAASELINRLSADHRDLPALLGVQACLAYRIGQLEAADELLQQTLQAFSHESATPDTTRSTALDALALAEALAECHHYAAALYFARLACQGNPLEARPHFVLARLLITRAEQQSLCQALSIQRHAPGPLALHYHALDTLESALKTAQRYSPPEAHPSLVAWRQRAQWAFGQAHPSPQELAEMSDQPDWLAAGVAAARRANQSIALSDQLIHLPAYTLACAQYALALLMTDPGRGLIFAEELVSHDPANPRWQALKAYLARHSGNLTLALESAQHAVAAWPDEARWQLLAGEVFAELGVYASAIQHLEKSVHLDPGHAYASVLLGRTYLQDGAPGNAIRTLENFSGRNSAVPEMWQALAEAHAALGEAAQADQCAQKWEALTPGNPEALILRARIAHQNQAPQEGLRLINQALSMRDVSPAARNLHAQLLMALGRHAEALDTLDEAIELATDPIPMLLERAEVLGQLHGDQAAMDQLTTAARAHPDSPLLYAAMAAILVRQGQLEEAIRLSRQALRTDQGLLTQGQRAYLHYQLGALLRQAGQLDQAVHHLSQALSHAPGLVDAYLELAGAFDTRRESAKALDICRRAIAVAPRDVRPYLQASRLLKESRNFADAESMLQRAINLDPQDGEIRRQLIAVATASFVHNVSVN